MTVKVQENAVLQHTVDKTLVCKDTRISYCEIEVVWCYQILLEIKYSNVLIHHAHQLIIGPFYKTLSKTTCSKKDLFLL